MDFYEVLEQVQRLPQCTASRRAACRSQEPQPLATGGTSSKRATICTQMAPVARERGRKAARPQKMALTAIRPLRVSRRG